MPTGPRGRPGPHPGHLCLHSLCRSLSPQHMLGKCIYKDRLESSLHWKRYKAVTKGLHKPNSVGIWLSVFNRRTEHSCFKELRKEIEIHTDYKRTGLGSPRRPQVLEHAVHFHPPETEMLLRSERLWVEKRDQCHLSFGGTHHPSAVGCRNKAMAILC